MRQPLLVDEDVNSLQGDPAIYTADIVIYSSLAPVKQSMSAFRQRLKSVLCLVVRKRPSAEMYKPRL